MNLLDLLRFFWLFPDKQFLSCGYFIITGQKYIYQMLYVVLRGSWNTPIECIFDEKFFHNYPELLLQYVHMVDHLH